MTCASTPHGCPHCRCDWDTTDDIGHVNTDAPFYGLVEEIDALKDVDPRGTKGGGRYSSRGGWRRALLTLTEAP